MPKFLLPGVTERIVAQLTEKIQPGKSVKQSELAFYFFGDKEGEKHIDTVRHFVSTNKLWKT